MNDEFLSTLIIERKEMSKDRCEFTKIEELKRVNPNIAREINNKYCGKENKSFILTSLEIFDEAITNKKLKEEIANKKVNQEIKKEELK